MPVSPPLQGARLTLERASRLLSSGKLTSLQLCAYCHELADFGDQPIPTIAEGNRNEAEAVPPCGLGLNAFAQISSREELFRDAAESDRRRAAGLALGALDGIPVSIKANIAAKGWILSAASRILDGWEERGKLSTTASSRACTFDSDVVHRLKRGGAVILGITNMDEFGMGSLGNMALPPQSETKNRNEQLHLHVPGFVRNPAPYLKYLVPSFVFDEELMQADEEDLDELWAHHLKMPLLWRHPDLLDNLKSKEMAEHPTISAGGSSSGSAASIALGSSLLSVGTDTGGSVRLPAAWTGVVGFKPTYGLISRFGLVAYASSLDTVGLLAPTSRCAAMAMDVVVNRRYKDPSKDQDEGMTGERDSTSSAVAVNKSFYNLSMPRKSLDGKPLDGLSVGIPCAFSVSECPSTVRMAWQHGIDRLREAGAEIKTVPSCLLSSDVIKASLPAYYVIACAEASSNFSRYDGIEFGWEGEELDKENLSYSDSYDGPLSNLTELERRYSQLRSIGFGGEVIRRILCGTSVLSSDRFHTHFEAATKVRAFVAREFEAAFDDGVDIMVAPTALFPPPDIGPDGSEAPDSTEMFANDVMTVPISLAGLPSISVPVKVDDGREVDTRVGLQVFGSALAESKVLLAASVIEEY